MNPSWIAATMGTISVFMLFYLNRKKLIGDYAKRRTRALGGKLEKIRSEFDGKAE